jgi:hypothetical protein
MNDRKIILGVIVVMITLGTTIAATPVLLVQSTEAVQINVDDSGIRKAPPAITGENVYVAWWTNKTGNDEVLFRASTDNGQTFGDKINLSNTTDAESTRVEIDSDADSVVVTWWETNDTSDVPIMRVSNDKGATFGPLLRLADNGTIASGEAEPAL